VRASDGRGIHFVSAELDGPERRDEERGYVAVALEATMNERGARRSREYVTEKRGG
jgi:hypothetical protein